MIPFHDDGSEDWRQSQSAAALFLAADSIVVSLVALCEFVWVARGAYNYTVTEVAHALRSLIDADKVVWDRAVAEFGIRVLEAGGDFADGVIARDGASAGSDVFYSFDPAVRRIARLGLAALEPTVARSAD